MLDALTSQARLFSYDGRQYDLVQAVESLDDELSVRAAISINDLGKAIQEAVVNDSRFPGLDVVMLSRDNNGLGGFYPNFFGDTLLRRALLNESASEALAWLQKVLTTRTATGKMMFLMWGVHVAEPLQVTPNITLCPLRSIPEGSTTRWIQKHYASGRHDSLIPTALDWAPPNAVLVMDIKISCFAQREPFPQKSPDESLADYYFLNDLFMLLPVAGPCAPVIATHWTTLDDPDLAFACRGEGRSGTMHEIFSIQSPSQTEVNVEILRTSHAGFLKLNISDKSRIRTALKRIVQARLRHSLGDRAVELCTSLETLGGDDQTNEISHKVATRFARFVGGDLAARKKNFKLIKAVYGIRSKMVHGGVFDPTKTFDGLTTEVAIEYVINLATRFIQEVLEQQRFPEWQEFDITEHMDSTVSHETRNDPAEPLTVAT